MLRKVFVILACLTLSSGYAQSSDEQAKVDQRFPGWRRAINTKGFEAWINRQPPEIALLAKSKDSEDAVRLLRYFHNYRYETQAPDYLMISCSIEMIGDTNFGVDPLLVLVNGFPAQISDSYIRFERTNGVWEINRTTGSIRVSTTSGKLFVYNGQCRKTSLQERKF